LPVPQGRGFVYKLAPVMSDQRTLTDSAADRVPCSEGYFIGDCRSNAEDEVCYDTLPRGGRPIRAPHFSPALHLKTSLLEMADSGGQIIKQISFAAGCRLLACGVWLLDYVGLY
jgi:hypothetical protein